MEVIAIFFVKGACYVFVTENINSYIIKTYFSYIINKYCMYVVRDRETLKWCWSVQILIRTSLCVCIICIQYLRVPDLLSTIATDAFWGEMREVETGSHSLK